MGGVTDEEEGSFLREWHGRMDQIIAQPGHSEGELDEAYDLLVEVSLEMKPASTLSEIVDLLWEWSRRCPSSELVVERSLDCLWWCLDTEELGRLQKLLEQCCRSEFPEVSAPAQLGLARFLKSVAESRPVEERSTAWLQRSRLLLDGLSKKRPKGVYAEKAARLLSALDTVSPGLTSPEFRGRDFDGREVNSSSFRGSIVVLFFWGYWCGACRQHLPRMAAIQRRYEGRGVCVLGVNSDQESTLHEMHDADKSPWRNIMDGSTTGPVGVLFGVDAWPTYVLIDRSGTIRYRNPPRLERAIQGLLGE
jgi:peroxiredoxin